MASERSRCPCDLKERRECAKTGMQPSLVFDCTKDLVAAFVPCRSLSYTQKYAKTFYNFGQNLNFLIRLRHIGSGQSLKHFLSGLVWNLGLEQKDFEKIPGNNIGYWLKNSVFDIFKN